LNDFFLIKKKSCRVIQYAEDFDHHHKLLLAHVRFIKIEQ
jgi:hypothetical protein